MARQNQKRQRADEATQNCPPAKRQRADEQLREHPAKNRKHAEPSLEDPSTKNRKRYPDEAPRDGPPAKKTKSTNHSPAFWDNLSKVWLTRRALREVDRRNNLGRSPKAAIPVETFTTDLARFARHGGPDLRHLRGYPEGISHTMASSRSSASSGSRRTQSKASTNATSLSTRSGKSSAYGPEFETYLTDYRIYPEGYEYPVDRSTPEPNNHAHQDLSTARSSLSPSRYTESKFRDFKRKDARATFENDVMTTVVPLICGDADIPNKQNILFTELAPVASTYKDLVRPKPDFFDGANIADIDEKVRDSKGDMYPLIIPTKHASVPVAPNFFLEAKAPKGAADVLKRQACYDGAYGARAMHALQNYGREEPIYDSNAYTYSSTYHAGTLKLYEHHLTAPTTPGGQPEYHMTKVKGFEMTSDRDTSADGMKYLKNARKLAKQHRDSFIAAANARARGEAAPGQEGDSSDEFVDCEEYQDVQGKTLATTSGYRYHQRDAYTEDVDVSQTSVGQDFAEPSADFASSFTSGFTYQTRPKRPRQSLSPPSGSKENHAAKSRSRRGATRQATELSTQAAASGEADATESYWVETYRRKGKVCFKNLDNQEVKTKPDDWTESTLDDGTLCYYWQSPKSGRTFWTRGTW